MSKQDVIVFTGAGSLAWLAATLFYAAYGDGLLEKAFWFYALNAFGAAALATFVFQVTARLRRIPCGQRLFPALAFGLPILVGGDLVVVNFQQLMSDDPVSLGRYGAFVVVLLIGIGASIFERGAQKARV
ncbi:MAG: hypothetical protein H7236_17940 [Gemmatimonadaceae bacterium]|nr:hypothetical protein [Caulobacter sp.]